MSWILTASGRHFDYLDPQPEQICILDIAQALACEARYNGHTRGFYSVAQHAYLASLMVPQAFALEALLHDATEAYLKDIPRPLKALLPDYRAIEERIDAAIRQVFGLPVAMSPTVKHADLVMLATEKRDLMPHDATPWPILDGIYPSTRSISPCLPPRANSLFLKRYVELIEYRRAA